MGGFAALPPRAGALFGASLGGVGARCHGTRGRAGGHTWAPSVCHRGHVRQPGGERGLGRAAALPGDASASLGVGGTVARSAASRVPHAGHLLRTGRFFRSRTAGAGGGSAACEEPFAFLGHVTAGCAGWRLAAAGAAGDAGRWPRGGREPGRGFCAGRTWSWWHGAGSELRLWACPQRLGTDLSLPSRPGGRGEAPSSVGSHGEERGGAAVVAVTVSVTWLLSSRPRQGGSAPHSQQGSLVMAVAVAVAVWQCQPRCAWQQLLSQACPVACQALSPAPALIRGARILQIGAVLERKWTRSWHSGRSLSDQEPHGRGAPAPAGTRCQLFQLPWFFSAPPRTFGSGIFCLESLPAMLEMGARLFPVESSALALLWE